MDGLPRVPMLAAEFIEWSLRQPEGKHYELVDGLIVESLSERLAHARVKGLIYRKLGDAAAAAHLSCEAIMDGMAVQVTANTVFEPDAAMRCGPPLDGNATVYDDPVIVVEVVSPSSSGQDQGGEIRRLLPYSGADALPYCTDRPSLPQWRPSIDADPEHWAGMARPARTDTRRSQSIPGRLRKHGRPPRQRRHSRTVHRMVPAATKGRRYELSDGRIVQMASERLRHASTKSQMFRQLSGAVQHACLIPRHKSGPTDFCDWTRPA